MEGEARFSSVRLEAALLQHSVRLQMHLIYILGRYTLKLNTTFNAIPPLSVLFTLCALLP